MNDKLAASTAPRRLSAAWGSLPPVLCLCVLVAACAPRYPEPPSDAYYQALHEHRLRFSEAPPRIQRLSDETREMEAIQRRALLRRPPLEQRFYVRHKRVEAFWALEARKARARQTAINLQAQRNRFLQSLEARAAEGQALRESRQSDFEQAENAPKPTLEELLRDRQR